MSAKNAMEVFSVLDKSNCRKCGEKTCLAFAGAVFMRRKSIDLCPTVSAADKERFAFDSDRDNDDNTKDVIDEYLATLAGIDFEKAAVKSGGKFKDGWLSVKVLGKDFKVNREGRFSSAIHINPWVMAPFLAYIIKGKGLEPTGNWISFREIKGGRERYGLFQKRCEDGMREVADNYQDLFADMVEIFQGREVEQQFASDVSVVLLPLPKVPIMICYWRPEDGLQSSLNIFFDETLDDNIGNDGIYSLCAGLTTMFEKLAERHGFTVE